jgi:hypothetical protein
MELINEHNGHTPSTEFVLSNINETAYPSIPLEFIPGFWWVRAAQFLVFGGYVLLSFWWVRAAQFLVGSCCSIFRLLCRVLSIFVCLLFSVFL